MGPKKQCKHENLIRGYLRLGATVNGEHRPGGFVEDKTGHIRVCVDCGAASYWGSDFGEAGAFTIEEE